MVGLWLLGLVTFLAWMAGLKGIAVFGAIVFLLLIGVVLSTLAGVSRRRHQKQKYHPVH